MNHDQSLPAQLKSWLTKSELVIFLFHGVVRECNHPVRNYTGKHLEAELFENCIAELSASGSSLSLDEVLNYCHTGDDFPSNAFAVTFDDGFENNVSIGLPILEKYEIPAMIYLTTRFVDENGMSWIDRVEKVVEETDHSSVKFKLSNKTYPINNSEEKKYFLGEVRKQVKSNLKCQPDEVADLICHELSPNLPILSGTGQLDKKLNWSQVRDKKKHPLLQFGGHSHTHPILSFLGSDDLDYEIETSLRLLSEKVGVDATHYSYPEGLAHTYSKEVIERLKLNGVRCCPTAIDGRNSSGSNPFELHRVKVA